MPYPIVPFAVDEQYRGGDVVHEPVRGVLRVPVRMLIQRTEQAGLPLCRVGGRVLLVEPPTTQRG